MNHSRRVAALVVLCPFTLPACHTYAPAEAHPVEAAPRIEDRLVDPVDPGRDALERLSDAILSRAPQPQSVGCLPLVSRDTRREGDFVSRYGERTAAEIAQRLKGGGFRGWALTPDDMSLRMASMNVQKSSLATLESAAGQAERLGVDLVTFGTVEHRHGVGNKLRDVLTVEIHAYDVGEGRTVATETFDVPSDRDEYASTWQLAKEESSWRSSKKWPSPEAAPTLDRELDIAASQLVARIAPRLDPAKVQGAVYVPPTDTSAFVRSIARLRAAQATFASEMARREKAAKDGSAAVDTRTPLVLNGAKFADVNAAEDYLNQLAEGLAVSNAGRFGESLASRVADALRPKIQPNAVRVLDAGFVEPREKHLVDGALATGALASTPGARTALAEAGVGLVVATKIERIGATTSLRLEAFDLASKSWIATTHTVIPAAFDGELAKQLGAEYGDHLEPIRDLDGATKSAWQSLYPRVKSGVVELAGPNGQGTGFAVRPDGLLMTNSHVASGVGTPLQAVFHDGSRAECTLVGDDPYWDIALVRVAKLPSGTHVFEFADDVAVGMEVAVLGRPKGTQGWVFTDGMVSSIDEGVATSGSTPRPSVMYTCATRPGSSGSPVLVLDGRIAAVHSAGAVGQLESNPSTTTELTGFAFGAPGQAAKRILDAVAR